MAVAGTSYTPSVVRPGCDGATTCSYDIVDGDEQPAGAGPGGHPDPADATLWDAAPVDLRVPGEWVCTWTFVGNGAGVVRQVFTVDPAPDAAVTGFSFATTADYVRHTGRSVPAGLRRSLIAASVEIERITVSARYTVAADGRPTDPQLRTALAEATCELVDWWDETGTESGGRSLITSASIGGVSLGWGGANTKNPQADRVGPKVWSMLMRAGLITPGAVHS